jgi:NAD-dependent SIR2 family protein deacetylase
MNEDASHLLRAAAEALAWADGLLIAAGAGMGVDSGLPDFRGPDGFWTAYPPFKKLGLRFEELAQPRWFHHDPALAWGFYGHRHHLYRTATPHAGFGILKRWSDAKSAGGFVFTSNVDGHFEIAGFDPERICEVHGRLAWHQCLRNCTGELHAPGCNPLAIDADTLRARAPWPACPRCGGVARPNVLMFNDYEWNPRLTERQVERLNLWLMQVTRLTIIEVGAGCAVPTVRRYSEELSRQMGARLVRINPREPQVPPGHIGLQVGGLEALTALARLF